MRFLNLFLQSKMSTSVSFRNSLRRCMGVGSRLLGKRPSLVWCMVSNKLSIFTWILAHFHIYCILHCMRFICVFFCQRRNARPQTSIEILAEKWFRIWHTICIGQLLPEIWYKTRNINWFFFCKTVIRLCYETEGKQK